MLQNIFLKLIDAAVVCDPVHRVAIIEDIKDRRQWIYREGDCAGRILIKEILLDRVILDGGKEEVVLRLRSSAGKEPEMSQATYKKDDKKTRSHRHPEPVRGIVII